MRQTAAVRPGPAAALVLMAVAVPVLITTLWSYRSRFDKSDFSLYYRWSREVRLGRDPWRPRAAAVSPEPADTDASVPAFQYCNYTPAFCRLFSPLTTLGPRSAYWIWQGLQVAALLGAILIVARELAPQFGAAASASAAAAVFLFPQVYGAFYEAQPTMLLLLLAVGAWASAKHGHSVWAGLMLGVATLLKLYPAAVGGYFLFRPDGSGRSRRVLLWAAGWTVAGVLLSGVGHWLEFFRYGVPVFAQPMVLRQERQIAILGNVYSLVALHYGEALPPVGNALSFALSALLGTAVIASAAVLTFSAPEEREAEGVCLSLWLIAAVLLSPLSWAHEAVFFIPLYLFVAGYLARGVSLSPGGTVLLTLGTVGLIAPYFWTPLRRAHLYFVAAALTYAAACAILLPRVARRGSSNEAPPAKALRGGPAEPAGVR